ncbi:AAA+ ATPase domain-containing protein [Artemisia annua]|uniref:AAA+ ATPase domain-containing protein n=1 Tax=Artemisia annua TaxID=35608 RepID=A0A2U1K8V8_ARTAN|nr:AAA+ ATPase domain-containing protein [Artemisia annua]
MSAIQAILISKPPIISNPNHHSKKLHFHRFNLLGFASNRKKFQPLLFALHQDNIQDSNSLSHGSEGQIGNINQESEKIGNGGDDKDDEKKKRFNLYVFFVGLFLKVKNGFEKMLFTWWPFWRQEKKLEMLFSEADLNPKDAAKQTALLVELNKHSPEAVIRRFEQRQYAVDSKGVAEYIRALVATNAIAEYLPDEQSGKPSGLPALVSRFY